MREPGPCPKECPGRCTTCHTTCEKYIQWRKRLDAQKARERKVRAVTGVYMTDAKKKQLWKQSMEKRRRH